MSFDLKASGNPALHWTPNRILTTAEKSEVMADVRLRAGTENVLAAVTVATSYPPLLAGAGKLPVTQHGMA